MKKLKNYLKNVDWQGNIGIFGLYTFWWLPAFIGVFYSAILGVILLGVLSIIVTDFTERENALPDSIMINVFTGLILVGVFLSFGTKTVTTTKVETYKIQKFIDNTHAIIANDSIHNISELHYWKLKAVDCSTLKVYSLSQDISVPFLFSKAYNTKYTEYTCE